MKIKNLPSVIKKRANVYIKKRHRPKYLMHAFDWSDTTEGSEYWILVEDGKFLDAENYLRDKNGDDMSEELFEVEKKPFFLDEALDVKVNEPEVVKPNYKLPWHLTTEDAPIFNSKVDVVSYKDEMLLKEDYLKKIDTGWKPFTHKETESLGTNSVKIINDSFKKAIEMKRDRIVDSVIEKFRSRSEVGIKKYGTTLDRNDLSLEQWLDHAIEEQMDSILYLTKIKEELKNK